ncbi:MerR family transcriptional regulator [Dokdonia sinensis]|uniref:MerR family transcriptional regulator n=2 Tax=Dokdonia sinensis TaxID=2479847 RepID=A0A3M0FU80_9FLAO|nr:MerR family transcriptional regulator [Dokdonia sinensis]
MDYSQRSNKKLEKMKIGELSKQTKVSRDTIRFYENKDLLTDISRPYEWNNYKDYGENNVKRIQIIKYLQRFSFTLSECKVLLDERDASPNNCVDKNSAFKKKLELIEKQISELKQTRDALIALVEE